MPDAKWRRSECTRHASTFIVLLMLENVARTHAYRKPSYIHKWSPTLKSVVTRSCWIFQHSYTFMRPIWYSKFIKFEEILRSLVSKYLLFSQKRSLQLEWSGKHSVLINPHSLSMHLIILFYIEKSLSRARTLKSIIPFIRNQCATARALFDQCLSYYTVNKKGVV